MTTPSHQLPPILIGDHLALDFVNSLAAPAGKPIEWLGSGDDFVAWLEAARAIDAGIATRFAAETDPLGAFDAVAAQARNLREWLRGFVARHAGTALDETALEELHAVNHLLARDDCFLQIEARGESASEESNEAMPALRWRRERRWATPEALLLPIAEAIGDLVCEVDFRLVRRCENPACTLVFHDRTKSHARRWCSMAVCGNRAKAAAHRARHRRAHNG